MDNKPTVDKECQPQRVLEDPCVLSQKDIDEHEAGGHATCRTWCEACVEGRGVGEPDLRSQKQESKIPILAVACPFVTSGVTSRHAERLPPRRWTSAS